MTSARASGSMASSFGHRQLVLRFLLLAFSTIPPQSSTLLTFFLVRTEGSFAYVPPLDGGIAAAQGQRRPQRCSSPSRDQLARTGTPFGWAKVVSPARRGWIQGWARGQQAEPGQPVPEPLRHTATVDAAGAPLWHRRKHIRAHARVASCLSPWSLLASRRHSLHCSSCCSAQR